MRTAIVFALAAALAATPAVAQNETSNATVDANAAMTMPADNGTVATNDMNALPPEAADTAAEPAPAPEPAPRSRGFPWGVIGLVGLVGLMGRKRRD